MLHEFAAVSGYLFWGCLGFVILLECILFAKDEPGSAVFLAMAALILSALFTDAFRGVTLVQVTVALPFYVLAGVAWSIWKWRGFLLSEVKRARADFDERKEPRTWAEFLRTTRRVPRASDNKERLTAWMVLWPIYATWDALTLPRRLFTLIYDRLVTLFDRMAASIFDARPST